MPEKNYNYKQVAELIGLKVQTLRTWQMQGRIKGVKYGSRVMFSESYVEELMKKGVPRKNGNL
jgi:excisionase family DNA binding protein